MEAAKAMFDLQTFPTVKIVERGEYPLQRQLDEDAGNLVAEKVRGLGLDVMMGRSITKITADENNNVKGVVLENGEEMECSTICFAVGFPPLLSYSYVKKLTRPFSSDWRTAQGRVGPRGGDQDGRADRRVRD